MQLPAISLASLIQASKPGAVGSLPWPNGSILSGRLENVSGATATLIIASQRLQASLPAGMFAHLPHGQLWLELLSRETPARFRILSRQQAINEVSARLADLAASRQSDLPAQARQGQASWNWQDEHPLHAHPGENGRRLMLDERHSHQPRGMVERSSDGDGFALHGRIDLDELGTLYFALQQQTGGPPQLTLRAASHASLVQLRQPFDSWLETQRQGSGEVCSRLQASLSEGDAPILKPRLSSGIQG